MRASPRQCAVQAAVLITLFTTVAKAQDSRDPRRAGPRKVLAVAHEIALARSAAPASIADSASVYVFTDTGYVLADRGNNGAACYVSRSWPASIEPHCFDSEGASTILPMHMREVELLHRGLSPSEAEREIGAGISSGRFRLPRRPAVSYMMSAAQELISDEGKPVGKWRPHVMIYYPFLEGGGAGEPDMKAAIISGALTATSSIMFVVARVRAGPSPGGRARVNRNRDDERHLVGRVIRRDERAFSRLYDRHTPYLYRLALRLTGGDEARASDIVHDAWVRAVERLAQFEWRAQLRTWLAGFVINVARENIRAESEDLSLDEVVAEDEPALPGGIERVDLERALSALAPGFRQVLVLHDIEGYKHEEIARLLGIEPGTSKSQLSRARAAMRRLLTGETMRSSRG